MAEAELPYVERPLAVALDEAGPRPPDDGDRHLKKNYAERLSRALAKAVARRLRPYFPQVRPTEEELGHEEAVGAAEGTKRLDVSVWDDRRKRGLLLDVSIKTYSFRDYDSKRGRPGRMTKNVLRNDHELRAEAAKVHARQPYAVLVGLMFVPFHACEDGRKESSSFAHMVLTFRDRTGRGGADDKRLDRFEAFYVALYEPEGDRRGFVRFFDVTRSPPRQGRPRLDDTLSFEELTAAVRALHDQRNRAGEQWAEAAGEEDYR
jgi:hypothetical protein